MKTLIVEDDFISRRLLQAIIEPYGKCEIAVNGREAIEAFKIARDEGIPYDLICLDIMLPEIDGQQVLKEIKSMEKERKTDKTNAVKIIMSTALDDFNNIKEAFTEECEAYLVKPLTKDKLLSTLQKIHLI